jgi:hypothetical protein
MRAAKQWRNSPVLGVCRVPLLFVLMMSLGASAILAFSDVYDNDPSQWTGRDVYQILNNSPWSKVVKLNFSDLGSRSLGDQTAGVDPNANRAQMPVGAGGMGRRGMGGGRPQGTYPSGPNTSDGNTKTGPAEVTVQWQSALTVRLALSKKAGKTVDAASFKPLDEYVIALIGLPITAVGGRAASADSDATTGPEQAQHIEERVKSSASILRPGHDPLTPTKVELDQGTDGRMLIHFSKADPIDVKEKSVEFRLGTGRTQLRKKFVLKDMEYQGKLEL